MKLLIATGIYPPEIGGPAGYVKGVATELANMGHEVVVITYGDNPEPNDKYQITNIKRGDSALVRYAKYAYECWKLARKADVIYAQGPVSEGLPATIAALLARKPLIMKIVGDYAWEQYQQRPTSYVLRPTSEPRGTIGTSDERREVELLDEFVTHHHEGKIRILEAVERWTASQAKQIIVPSKYLKSIVTKWGIEPAKVNVVYNSIAPLPSASSQSEVRSSELQNKKIVLTAVRAVPWKGGDFLCDVLKDLPQEYVLAVAGDGPELENWKIHAQEIGVANRVLWLGRLSRSDLANGYRNADLFVLATGYEGFPHVVVEAASMGLPCIVSDKGGNPEIAELFPGLVAVAEYQNKEAWVEAILNSPRSSAGSEHPSLKLREGLGESYNPGLPEELGFQKMVSSTLTVLKSARCLNHDYQTDSRSNLPNCLNQDCRTDSRSNLLDYSNHNICDVTSEKSRFEVRNSKFDVSRVLSIGLEKKLFEPGKVRDRIINQLEGFDAVIIVFAKEKFDEQIAPNVRVISTNSWNKLFYVTDALLVAWRLRKSGFNVVTSQDPMECGLVAYLASKLFKSALAIQDHGYVFHGNYFRKESWLNQFRYLFARFLVAKADAVRVVSQRTEDALINLGIDKEKIVRFPLALNITPPSIPPLNLSGGTEKQSPSLSLREGNGEGYFLLVCRFVPIKRIDLAIHAFSIFAKQNPDVNLKIVGAGPLEDQIQQWIADFDLQGRVEIIPWTENLGDLYRDAVATLITSDREGFGMTAVESLACGTPVIMTDVGCAHEVVKNGENGIIVPVGDVMAMSNAMEKMLLSSTQYAVHGTQYSDQSSKFHVPSSAFASGASMNDFLQSAMSRRLRAKKKEEDDFWKYAEKSKSSQSRQINLLICVEAVDANDPLMGHFTTWLAKAADEFAKITVLALRVGEYDLPANISVHRLKEKYRSGIISRLETLINLYRYSIKFRKQYNAVFSRGEPKYIIFCGWLWRLMGKKVVLFFAHYKTSRLAKIANKIANVTVTSVPEAAIGLKAIPIGQAIDSEKFKPRAISHDPHGVKKFLVFGRVSQAKRVVEIVEAFKQANVSDATLTIVGKPLTEEYAQKVRQEIAGAESISWVEESVPYAKVPALYHDYDVLINATPGSLDKTIVEAAMSGLLVIASSNGYGRLLGDEQKYLCPQSVTELSQALTRICDTDGKELEFITSDVGLRAQNAHSLAENVKKIYNLF
ncbi:MAG: glycosyltransferase [Patescibacteria group bacterium]